MDHVAFPLHLLGRSEALIHLLLEMPISVLSLKAHSILQSASPSSPVQWEEGWEEGLIHPLGWQRAGGEPSGRVNPLSPLRRANALEEQLKEQELRADQTLLEEIKKQRELLSKMEREKSIEIENLQARWGWGRAGWWQVSWTHMYTLEYVYRLPLRSCSLWGDKV